MSVSRREFVGGMAVFAGFVAGGCAGLRGTDGGVWFDYYGRGSTEVTKTFRLR